jgi:hypothetical protein
MWREAAVKPRAELAKARVAPVMRRAGVLIP